MPDVSFVLPLILQSAVLPFAVALALLAAARTRLGAAAAVLAVATGFLASYFATLHAQWSPLPKVALDWVPLIVVAGAVAALVTENIRHAPARRLARLAVSLAAAALVVWPALQSLGAPKAALATLAIGVLVAAAWTVKAHAAARRPTPPLMLAVVAGGAGLALMLDSSQSIGQLSGGLASVLAACLAFNLPRVRAAFSPAAAGLAVLMLGVLLANAHLYAGFSLGYVALLVAAVVADPLLSAFRRARPEGSDAAGWATAAVLTAIPVVVTIGLAVKAAHDSGGY